MSNNNLTFHLRNWKQKSILIQEDADEGNNKDQSINRPKKNRQLISLTKPKVVL